MNLLFNPLKLICWPAKLDGITEIATLVKPLETEEQLFNPNVVKVVISKTMEALYFSRSTIPHIRNIPARRMDEQNTNFTNTLECMLIALMSYERLTKLSVSSLEKAESLEQLRWLENGFKITVTETLTETIGIDTPE